MDYFNSTEEGIFAEKTFSAAFDSVQNDSENSSTFSDISSSNLANSTSSPPINIDCGRLTRSELLTWIDVQYYTEGVLFSIVGAIGLFGNLISIAILLTK